MMRCPWCGTDPFYVQYHDTEWGVPIRGDDNALFERLCLEGAQAGLSWIMILRKRENYRAVFDKFDPAIVARYDNVKVAQLLANPGIVRNKLKINAAITNAARFLEIQSEFGSFERYLWDYVDGKTVVNTWQSLAEVPAETETSRKMSKDLQRRGFKFVGPVVCYSTMQAVGLVNDHLVTCFRHAELTR